MEPTQSRNLGIGMSSYRGNLSNRSRAPDFQDPNMTYEVSDNSQLPINQSSYNNQSGYGPSGMDLTMESNTKKKRNEIVAQPHHISSRMGASHLATPNNNDTSLNLSYSGIQSYPFGDDRGLPPIGHNGQIEGPGMGLTLSPIQNSADFGPNVAHHSHNHQPSPPKKSMKNGIAQGRPVAAGGAGNVFSPGLSGMDKLALLQSIFVKQKFEMLEMLTGCETENRYKVYAAGQGLERVGRPIFKCKEKSSFMARNCLSGDCRPFQMRILHEDREDDEEEEDMCLLLDRLCKCTVCCMNRPEITVTLKEGGANKYLGKVTSDWACCDMLFTVLDHTGQLIYKIYGDACQWGLYCNCPCDSCAKIVFNIQSPLGEPLGEIYKLYSGAVKEFLTDTDNFCCVFPDSCPPEHKAILLAVVLFIDFRYFEQSPAQNNGLV